MSIHISRSCLVLVCVLFFSCLAFPFCIFPLHHNCFHFHFEEFTLQVLHTSYPTTLILFSVQSLSHSIGSSHTLLEDSFFPFSCTTSPSWRKAFPSWQSFRHKGCILSIQRATRNKSPPTCNFK